jgi:hypothetical protein
LLSKTSYLLTKVEWESLKASSFWVKDFMVSTWSSTLFAI